MGKDGELSFWEHLDILRGTLWRIVCVMVCFVILSFMFKEELFGVVLTPKSPDFCLYNALARWGREWNIPSMIPSPVHIRLVTTQLTSQFMAHINVSLYAGLLFSSPYIIYELYRFVSPALYLRERTYTVAIVCSGYVLFLLGVLLDYFLLFPLTLRFLAGYVVSVEVMPMITLESYLDTFMMLSLAMGVVFELPLLAWMLARMGVLKDSMLQRSRRYAVVGILIVAAVITPTSDIFTLLAVSLPIYVLYEISIWVVRVSQRK